MLDTSPATQPESVRSAPFAASGSYNFWPLDTPGHEAQKYTRNSQIADDILMVSSIQ
jgi:hypothetical protein